MTHFPFGAALLHELPEAAAKMNAHRDQTRDLTAHSSRVRSTRLEARLFERSGLALRLAPFVGLMLVTLAVVPFTYDGAVTEVALAAALVLAVVGAAFLVPWARFPAGWQAVPPLSLYVFAALIRDTTGGHASVFTALLLLPVAWFALYGTVSQVLMSMAGCALAIGLPVALDPGPKYPSVELARAALDSLTTGALGIAGVNLGRRIREREALSRSLLDSAHEAFVSVDREGTIVEWNHQAERDFGWSRSEAVGRSLVEAIVPAGDRDYYLPALRRLLGGDRELLGRRFEITAMRCDGSRFPVELSISSLQTSHGPRFNAFLRDISDRRSSEQALQEANQRFRSAFDDAAIGMAIVSPEGRWLRVNRALAELTGYSQEELVGMSFATITHPDDVSGDLRAQRQMLEGERDRFQAEKRYFHADGHVIWVSLSTTVVRDGEGRALYLLSQMQDISERKEAEARLAHRATHDELTGLPNRGVLEERIVLALNRLRRERRPVTVLYLDLDGFKQVNDSYGHDAGDAVLVAIAKRLTTLLRPTDVVSRIGGDEFAIVCEGMNEHGATRLAMRVANLLPKPIELDGQRLTVTPSIGITLARDPGLRPGELLAEADIAMYFAKEEGRSGYAFFEEDLRARVRSRFTRWAPA